MKHRVREVLRGRGERQGCNQTESDALVAVVTNHAITSLDSGQAVHLATRGVHMLAAQRQSTHGIGGKEVLDGCNLVVHVGNQAGGSSFDSDHSKTAALEISVAVFNPCPNVEICE
eukprot:453675-Rhodomonas_salina.1